MARQAFAASVVARLRARGPIAAVAFAVGIAGATGLHFAQLSSASVPHASVMLDRDISAIHPRSFVAAPSPASADPGSLQATEASSEGKTQPAAPAVLPVTAFQPASTAAGYRRIALTAERRNGRPADTIVQQAQATASNTDVRAGATSERAPQESSARCTGGAGGVPDGCAQRTPAGDCDDKDVPLPGCVPPISREHGQ